MPSYQLRQTSDGTPRHFVRFRLNGTYSGRTFDTELEAREFIQLCDDLGDTAAALRYSVRLEETKALAAVTLDKWFEEFKATRTGIEERTLIDYQRVYDRHIKPALGSMPIDSIDRPAVAGLINSLARPTRERDALAAKTIANVHGILAATLNEAVAQKRLESNPCIGMRLPRAGEVDRVGERFLTHAEFAKLEAAMDERYRPLILTLVGTGMRWAELTALRAGEVDLDGLGTIKIIRATKWVPGQGHHDGVPKTKKSRRTIIVPRQVRDALRPLLEGKKRDDYVFLSSRGQQVRHSTFHRLYWKPACAKAGLDPAPRIHDLRHTHASWLLEMGIGLEAIQDQLGHESIMTTRKVYGHLQPAMREALMKAAEAALDVGREISEGPPVPPVVDAGTPALPGGDGPA